MPKVITLTGMHQASSLKGWDACDPKETRDSRGNAVVRCAGTKAITVAGTRKMSSKEATKRASRAINRSGQGLKCDDTGRCFALAGTPPCSRKAISNWLNRAKRAVKVYDCDQAADLMYAIGRCREVQGASTIKGSTWKAMSSRVRHCYRKQGGVQRALRV
jgi:hypothetical protein